MFETPTRNHVSIVLERAGAVLALFAVFFTNYLKDYGWEIFTLSFYKALYYRARFDADSRTMLFVGIGLAFMLWYIYISFRYWRSTTFYIDGVDFVYERKTMFRAASRLPIQNIAVVNVERSIFERLIGTSKVKIDLNSSRTAGATDFKFVLKRAQAKALRDALMEIKQTLSADEETQEQVSAEEMPQEERETIAVFSVAEALRHKVLSLPVISLMFTMTVLFVLPQLKISGTYDMSRLWYLLVIAVIGEILAIVRGTLNLGDYKVERDSSMVYISCGVLNKRHYMFEMEKINAVMINQPLLARFFGMASIDLAVVGFGNEKNETTHLSLITDMEKVQEILEKCAPDFACKQKPQRCHPLSLLYTVPRAAVFGAATLLLGLLYKEAFILAIIVFVIALIGAISQYLISDFAQDENVVRYTSGMFNKKTAAFKYGDIQSMTTKTNIFYQKFGLGRLNFSILGAASVRAHKTAVFRTQDFDIASAHMVEHEDSVLLGKLKS